MDYTTGQPSRSTVRRMRLTLVAITLLALVFVTARTAGLISPRLEWPRHSTTWSSDYGPGRLGFSVPVENHGWTEVTIVGVGQSLPGFELEPDTSGLFPLLLSPGNQVSLPVEYRVTDCTRLDELLPLPVRVQTIWGLQTVHVDFETSHDLECQT